MTDTATTQTTEELAPRTVRIPSSTPGDDIVVTGGEGKGKPTPKEEGETTKPEGEGDGTGADTKDTDPVTGKPIDYKVKFSESTRENQRIAGEIKTLQDSRAGDRATAERLQREMEDLRKVAAKENPEGLEKFDLKKSHEENSRKLAELTLDRELDSFASKTVGAPERREALKNLAKAFPSKSLAELWNENFAGVSEAIEKAKKDKTTSQTTTQPEKGKGTSTREPGGETVAGLPVAEFNKLSVGERRALLTKAGIA